MAPILNLAFALAMPALSLAAALPNTDLTDRATTLVGTPEIVGGTAAALGEFPYIVSLSYGGSHFCGGQLLNAYTVLTAAHCSVSYSVSSVKVRAGTLNYASGGTSVGVSKVAVHPSYNSATTNNDIALWHLSTALPVSSTIGYATLPVQGSDPVVGSTVTTAGWGLTSESGSTLPSALRKVSVPVISRTSCQAEYGTSAVTTNMFCAGLAVGGKDSCSGDSGGPIIDAATGVLQGTVSWGQGCAEAGYAGVYSRVGNYVTYIKAGLWTGL
ncbi:putative Trypsin [Sclerotinia borealis F-4128]|uniref:Putative Trypsin n=1 Tax=Sclerotinia borealis (strain F-4128) TaxID=1432307 RepID=W9CJU1_SCLBF|nr:putative Trypsin [Sclerotinia borealis F-4128]